MGVALGDVAAAAGVSVSTVSRVLGGRGAVAQATRDRVEAALETTGYARSTLLARTPARLVAVCPPAEPEHWQIDVCREVALQLQAEGLLVSVPFLDPAGAEVRASAAAGAAVVVTPTFTSLETDLPVVRFAEAALGAGTPARGAEAGGRRAGAAPGSERIAARIDLTGGLTLAFDHLAALGHRRIGLVCNDTGDLADMLAQRFRAEHPARAASSRLGEWIAAVPKSHAGGMEAADRLRDATCTAVIVQSALQLYGVFAAMRQRRLVVPRDLSAVGFGDSVTMRYTGPPATVLALDTPGMAAALAAGVRTVLDLPGARLPSIAPTFRPRLVARESTTAVRQ